jgi:hypothetical protein
LKIIKFKIIIFIESVYWTTEQFQKVEEFYKESDKFSKSIIKEEKVDSFINGILTEDENFNDLCINLFDKFEQRVVDSIIKCLKEFLEKLKHVLSSSV